MIIGIVLWIEHACTKYSCLYSFFMHSCRCSHNRIFQSTGNWVLRCMFENILVSVHPSSFLRAGTEQNLRFTVNAGGSAPTFAENYGVKLSQYSSSFSFFCKNGPVSRHQHAAFFTLHSYCEVNTTETDRPGTTLTCLFYVVESKATCLVS